MPLRIVTPPAAEPITLDEAKGHLRVEDSEDDAYILALISAARQYVEQIAWRGIVTQTVELILHRFPILDWVPFIPGGDVFDVADFSDFRGNRRHIELKWGNVGTLASDAVKYIDTNGVQQTLDASVYSLDNVSFPAALHLAPGQKWVETQRDRWDAVRIQYPVGFAVADVPTPIKQAMLLLISQMFEHRTPEVAGVIAQVQFAVDALLAPYRMNRL